MEVRAIQDSVNSPIGVGQGREGGRRLSCRSLAQSASTVRTGKKLVDVRATPAAPLSPSWSVGRSVGCLVCPSESAKEGAASGGGEKSGCEKKERDPIEGNWVNASLKTNLTHVCSLRQLLYV